MPTLIQGPLEAARPGPADDLWDDPPSTTPAEDSWKVITRRLASAVLMRAITDAAYDYGGKDTIDARIFLQGGGEDLQYWCELAEVNLEQMQAYAKRRWPDAEAVKTRILPVKADASIHSFIPAASPVEVRSTISADPRWPLLEPWARGIRAR